MINADSVFQGSERPRWRLQLPLKIVIRWY